jgi:hypothetical protein
MYPRYYPVSDGGSGQREGGKSISSTKLSSKANPPTAERHRVSTSPAVGGLALLLNLVLLIDLPPSR